MTSSALIYSPHLNEIPPPQKGVNSVPPILLIHNAVDCLVVDQTEARRAEKMFFGDRAPPSLLKGLDYRPPSPFERRTSTGSPFSLFKILLNKYY